jgi:branched-chain amino acid transport system permease protein
VTGGALIAVYLLLRALLASPFGRIAVAVRENEVRASLLGYDTRLVKLGVFTIGGAIAGLAGALYVNWGAFVGPTIFSLSLSAQIIWVTVGGLGTLIGPIVGCFIIQYIVAQIGSQQTFNSNLILGAILLAFVLLLPGGLVPTLRTLPGHVVRFVGRTRADVHSLSENQPVGAE